ncbi:hypothetical protein BWK47_05325 [Synechocystis sp. CACIAM 05]|nr:hypothetical protein BWK47_05325 [Synechocystis sp. CACIAM 05]
MNSDIFKIRPNFTVQILLFSEREGIMAATINQGPRATSKGGFEQLTQSLNFGKIRENSPFALKFGRQTENFANKP